MENQTNIVNEKLELNWESIDTLITNKQCKIQHLSKELNVSQKDVKNALIEHYGTRIVFKRGRYGGVYWAAEANQPE